MAVGLDNYQQVLGSDRVMKIVSFMILVYFEGLAMNEAARRINNTSAFHERGGGRLIKVSTKGNLKVMHIFYADGYTL